MRQCGKLVRKHLEWGDWEAFSGLKRLESIEAFEEERKRLNDVYVTRTAPSVKTADGTNLTDEQAEAIATDEDVTLVLAGAGTSKTKVITGKVEHLVRNQGASPSEILVLAFNAKAADEIRARLPSDLSGTHVYTFNAFGNRVVAESEGKKPAVSKLAEDPKELNSAIDATLLGLLLDPMQPDAIKNFILSNGNLYRSPFEFKTVGEYRKYVRKIELRALSGSLVKSFEELEIANYLAEHNIDFVYESSYKTDTSTFQHRQYRPDFYLTKYDIYIEHFALDEKGCPPSGWDEYEQGVKWKRATHKKYGSTLIETYSWQYSKCILLQTLRSKLEEKGVKFERVPDDALIERLKEHLRSSRLANLLSTFLNHVKTEDLNPDKLRSRAIKLDDRKRNLIFLEVFEQVRTRYEDRLSRDQEIDFHDQINFAAGHIQQCKWESPYRYVLVDEFQDISKGRMRLLKELRRRDVAYFLVGDDWQSIYRFTGSNVGLVRNCGDYLGYVARRTLSRTFRFGNGILKPSTEFIKRNPEQTQRKLMAVDSTKDKGVTIIASYKPKDSGLWVKGGMTWAKAGVKWALQDIQSKTCESGSNASVLVLGRYNNSKTVLSPIDRSTNPNFVEFSTVHKAKGREADYVVVLDLKDGQWGFPSKVEDDPIMDIVLPPVRETAYPFSEERRLFYVAMTRARVAAYLITDSTYPSTFIEELQKHDDIPQVGAFAPKCPSCGVGALVEREGPFSAFMGCTEYGSEPSCRYTKEIDINPDASTGNVLRRFSSEEGLP